MDCRNPKNSFGILLVLRVGGVIKPRREEGRPQADLRLLMTCRNSKNSDEFFSSSRSEGLSNPDEKKGGHRPTFDF
jgi:hypothetical protein